MPIDRLFVGSGTDGSFVARPLATAGRSGPILEPEDRFGGFGGRDEFAPPGYSHDMVAATCAPLVISPTEAANGPHSSQQALDDCHTRWSAAVMRPGGKAPTLMMARKDNIVAFDVITSGDGNRHVAHGVLAHPGPGLRVGTGVDAAGKLGA